MSNIERDTENKDATDTEEETEREADSLHRKDVTAHLVVSYVHEHDSC